MSNANDIEHIKRAIQEATFHALAAHTDVFSAQAMKAASAEFFGLGFERTYFYNYRPEELADHLYTYMCAKADGSPDRFYCAANLHPTRGGCVITTQRKQDMRAVDTLLDEVFLTRRSGTTNAEKTGTPGFSVRCYFSQCSPTQTVFNKSEGAVVPTSTTSACAQGQGHNPAGRGLALVESSGLSIYVVRVARFTAAAPSSAEAEVERHPALRFGHDYFRAQNAGRPDRKVILERYDQTLEAVAARVCRQSVFMVSDCGPEFKHSDEIKRLAPDGRGVQCLQLGANIVDGTSLFTPLSTLISQIPNVRFIKKMVETFRHGVTIYTFYVAGATPQLIRQSTGFIALLPNRGLSQRAIMDLYFAEKLSAVESLYATAATIFAFYFAKPRVTDEYGELQAMLSHRQDAVRKLNTLNDSLFREIVVENSISAAIAKHLPLFKAIFSTFAQDRIDEPGQSDKLMAETSRIMSHAEREIFRAFIRFNQSILKTNMFKEDKAAMAFRLDPAKFFEGLPYPRIPFGIYFVVGGFFRGFHLRFADIARGGIRLIRTTGPDPEIVHRRYAHNRASLFQETYNLAYTQTLKNKDIPEAGSKGTILVSTRAQVPNKVLYLQYVDAICDLMIPGVPGVVSRGGERGRALSELLFFGPDEGTALDFPDIAAERARVRGYKFWQSFTTGKSPALGGIPHDAYACTTRGVRQYALGVYRKLKLDQTKLTKFQTGGPDGDLGSNEIKLGEERYVSILDGFASVHDPDGISRAELLRLANARKSLKFFDKSKLGPRGFHVGVNERNVTLPDGAVVANGTLFRDSFHFSKYAEADVFVPCGGRPASVTLENVTRALFKNKVPGVTGDTLLAQTSSKKRGGGEKTAAADAANLRWKYVIEGANLFFTNDARICAERAGVVLFKDASTNKGGVTSSSLEVLSGLALPAEEHARKMCVAAGKEAPQFYKDFVVDITKRIEANAQREFECLWRDTVEKGAADGILTNAIDQLSLKILRFKEFVQNSDLGASNAALFKYVIEQFLPATLKKAVPLSEILQRVPRPYLDAIFSTSIASGFVYERGLDGNEFDFFEYMLDLTKRAQGQTQKVCKI